MKKFAVILIVLSLTRIGVAYADSTNSTDSQNYFFGTKAATENLNQVLALLVGPQGEPGPAGVAGKDGLIGMDGKDGVDGLPGAPGAVGAAGPQGPAGSSVLAVAFTGAQGTCTTGGVKFTDGAGTVSFTCNGLNGSAGATGATGATGPAGAGGSGTGGTIGYGQGEVTVGVCEVDNKIVLGFKREFTGTDFVFTGFTLGDLTTDGDIESGCATKTVSIYVKIKSGTIANSSGHYLADDIVKCTYTLQSAANWPTTNPQFTMNSANTTCATIRTPLTAVALNEIRTADYTDKIGLEIG
ncbi:MAG: collagen-like protein [Candidatus Planktophila sp.]|nr:collagen-like protein [Candidatus Planktophila sp.]